MDLAFFDPINLQVRAAELVGELLPGKPFGFANLLDSPGNERKPLGHSSRISDSDISAQAVSGGVTEVRDSVERMRRPLDDLTPEACEQWMLDVGYKLENGRLDHARAMKDAGVKSKWAMVKKRWKDGEAPEDRAKIAAVLLSKDRKQSSPTLLARRMLALEQWDALALDLLEDVEIFEKQIEETRRVAAVAKAKSRAREAAREAAALEAQLSFSSPVPAADSHRRTRK